MMTEIIITEDMVSNAKVKAGVMGTLPNSILRGKGNLTGFIGEQIAQIALGGVINNTYDYDLELDDGTLVEVKTKQTTCEPQGHYECSVAQFNTGQQCDAYAFVRVHLGQSIGWYLGMLSRETYYDKAVFRKKGWADPSNGFIVKANCYNVPISELEWRG